MTENKVVLNEFNVVLDVNVHDYITRLLKDRYYSITDLSEMSLINTAYNQLGIRIDNWMCL